LAAFSQRLAFAIAACAIGALPAACASGANSLPSTFDSSSRSVLSGGPAAKPPATPLPVTPSGGGGGNKAPLPGSVPFSSGCGQIDSVSSTVTVTAGFALDTIVTKVAEHNCVDIFYRVDFVNNSTGRVDDSRFCFSFIPSYTCAVKFIEAQQNTTYQIVVTVWDATLAGHSLNTPVDPSWIYATESQTVSTVGAPLGQGA
jgi:hypothetical protein